MKISNLTVEYRTKQFAVRALDNVTLTIPHHGYSLGVVGESGSGKTTLGLSLLRLIEPPGRIVDGNMEYNERDLLRMTKSELLQYRRREVTMVYQSAMNSLNPVKKAIDHIVELIREDKSTSRTEARDNAMHLLSEMGIPANRANSYPFELSGGMRQRVVIALAIALSPKMLIADEPTSALDVVVQKHILTLLNRYRRDRNLSLIFITHEIALLPGLVSNVAVMYSGEIVEAGPTQEILSKPLHPYTEMLLNSMLDLSSTIKDSVDQKSPEHVLPTMFDTHSCKYVGRCRYAFAMCRNERPVLKEVQKGRWVSCHKYQ